MTDNIAIYRTIDHPEADGRIPQDGEREYLFDFELEGGRRLKVAMGKRSRDGFAELLSREESK